MRGALSAFPLFGIIADALEVRQTTDGDGGWWGSQGIKRWNFRNGV
jgi:hypothetical protein